MKLAESERAVNSLEIEVRSTIKQNEQQRKMMSERISQLQQQIAAEKDTREIWINRYEKEQKAHISTHTEYIELKGQMQQLAMQLETQKAGGEMLNS